MTTKQKSNHTIDPKYFILLIASESFETQVQFLTNIKKNPKSLKTLHQYLKNLLKNLAERSIKKPNYYLCNQIFILLNILAYLEEENTFDSILFLTKLDLDVLDKIYIDEEFLINQMPYFLSYYTKNNWLLLKKIIDDPSISILWKIASILTLSIIVIQKEALREPIINYLRKHLQNLINTYDEENFLIEIIIESLNLMYPLEALEEIKEAYGRYLLDNDYISIDEISETLTKTQSKHFQKLKKELPIKEYLLDDLRMFFNDEDNEIEDDSKEEFIFTQKNSIIKSSRNKPCPCGSNKKYKKCCAKTSIDPKLLSSIIPPISFEPDIEYLNDIEPEDVIKIEKFIKSNIQCENSDFSLPLLLELKEKYPNASLIYHLIDCYYFSTNQIKKSFEILYLCMKKFPNDLIWKIKYAEYLLRRGEYDKIDKLFNNKFTLQELYPEKTMFSIIVIEAFFPFMVNYFVKIKKLDKAILYLQALKEFVPNKELIENLEKCFV